MFRKFIQYGFCIVVTIVIGAFSANLLVDGSVAAYSYMEDRTEELQLTLAGLRGTPVSLRLQNRRLWDTATPDISGIQIALGRPPGLVRENAIGLAQVSQTTPEIFEPISETSIPSYDSITLMFVGDLMLDRGVKQSVDRNFVGDYNKLFENIGLLREADVVFGNLEGPASDKGYDRGKKYSFRMDPAVLSAMYSAGFDVVSFANNHIADWGKEAFRDTMSQLKAHGILYTGAGFSKNDAEKVRIIEVNGIKMGFLAFSDVGPNWMAAAEQKPGILIASDPDFEEIIGAAAKEVDMLAVSFHWGEEYKEHNSRQEKLGKLAIDSGATLIIGHHPHVVQDTEKYNNGLIAYSLGNFIFDQYFSEETMQGMLLEVTVGRNPFSGKTEIWNIKKHQVKLNQFFQPQEPEEWNKLELALELQLESEPLGLEEEHEFSHFLDSLASSADNICPSPKEPYPDFLLTNIDQVNGIGSYIPSNLLSIKDLVDTQERDICLTKESAFWLSIMSQEAQTANVTLAITSGFRDKNTQDYLYENWTKGETSVIQGVAIPGHSEHQLGTTVDLTSPAINYQSASTSFASSQEYKWLKENAYKYGFIESYPKGRELLTGYKYEPWHWRYVGVENAKMIKESKLTLQEFL